MYPKIRFTFFLLFLLYGLPAHLQIEVPFDSPAWKIGGNFHQLTVYQGQQALTLQGAAAQLKDVQLQDGIIEWDMAFSPQRGFAGLRFRITDAANSEEFYLRPHQSGNPDANQYCPVDNGMSSWQLFHGTDYSAAIEYPFHEWFHVKLVVAGSRAEVYIKDMTKPLFHIPHLKQTPTAGGLALYASRTPVYFANFSYTPMDSNPPELVNPPVETPSVDPNTIREWDISQAFAEKELDGLLDLEQWDTPMNWTPLQADAGGLTNIAEVTTFQRESANTVFVRYLIEATHQHTKALQLGFSDRARVFFNGQVMFSGNDSFRTRDYRYLGTIGYHDTIYLPLKKGKNELWIAVSENFGGWAVQGRWLNLDGLVAQ
ncbi:MAG: hypothetical protein AAFO03_00075 [Bacteroidota bacterium]